MSRGNPENYIHGEHHRGLKPPVPANHEEQAFLHTRRLSAPNAVSGLSAYREAPARQMSELGSGAQPDGAHVRRPGSRRTLLS